MRQVDKIILPLLLAVSLANCSGDDGGDLPDGEETRKWGTPILIESGTGTAYSPRVNFDSDDNAISVWIQDDFADFSVFANTTVADRWGTEERIESRIFDAAQPWIAADGNGNAIAVWVHDYRITPEKILASWYLPGSGWQVEEQINSRFGTVRVPRAVIDDSGNALSLWAYSNGDTSIYSNHYSAIGGWDLEEPIESGDAPAYGPEIAINDQGNAVAIWSQDDGDGVFSIYANHYIPGQGWQQEELIESGAGTTRHDDLSVYLDVDMDAAGNAIAAWSQEDDDGNFSVYANRYTPNGGWGEEQIIESRTETVKHVAVDMDSTGNAFVAWQQEDQSVNVFPAVSSIYSNRYDKTRNAWWDNEQLIESGDENAIYPEIQTDPGGNAIAVWIQGDSTGSLYSNRYVLNDDNGWGTEELLESNSGDVDPESPPSLAIDSEGNAVVVWAQEEFTGSGRYSIYSSRFE
ncbi:MAG: hypothetical protein PVH32_06795 [Chromatiales bacterium]|jgi:hypothetical protein